MQPSDRYRLFSSLTLCEGNINTFFLSWHHFSDKNFISWPTTETRVVGSSRLLMCAHLNPWQCCQVSEFIWPGSEETDVGHFPRKVETIPAWWICRNQSVGTSLLGIATALWVNIFIQGVEYVCSAVWPVRSPARRTLRRTWAELFWARIKAELWAVLLSALEAEESGMSLSWWMPVKEVWTFKQNETLNTGRLFFPLSHSYKRTSHSSHRHGELIRNSRAGLLGGVFSLVFGCTVEEKRKSWTCFDALPAHKPAAEMWACSLDAHRCWRGDRCVTADSSSVRWLCR